MELIEVTAAAFEGFSLVPNEVPGDPEDPVSCCQRGGDLHAGNCAQALQQVSVLFASPVVANVNGSFTPGGKLFSE